MGIAFVYAAYLAVSIGLTVIVASALSRSGRVYLAGVFGGDDGMAAAVNRMLVVGFCLLSLGYAALTLRTSADIHGPGQAIGVLSVKVGEELLVLGALHLVNMMFFTRLRRRQDVSARPGAPAAGRRGTDWPPAATVPGRPAGSDRPGAATSTGQPSGTDWPPAGTVPARPATVDRPGAATRTARPGATDRPTAAAGGGEPATAGPGELAAAWPAPPAAHEVLH
jgi:hypothetical protein